MKRLANSEQSSTEQSSTSSKKSKQNKEESEKEDEYIVDEHSNGDYEDISVKDSDVEYSETTTRKGRYDKRNEELVANNGELEDLFETQKKDIEIILPLLREYKDKQFFDPCCGKGVYNEVLVSNGFKPLIQQDKFHHSLKQDYLTTDDPDYDVLISNPPYCKKFEFLSKMYRSGKPFIVLLPISTITHRNCANLFKQFGVAVFIIHPHPKFMHNGTLVSPESTGYFAGNISSLCSVKDAFCFTYLSHDDDNDEEAICDID